jgi:MoxR-like ATPase
MLDAHGDHDAFGDLRPVVRTEDVVAVQAAARAVHVAPSLRAYLVDIADATRRHPRILLPMSPRSTLALLRAARARAAAAGRAYVVPDDIKALAEPVLAHRLLVSPEAQLGGIRPVDALNEAIRSVPVPTGRQK